MFLVSFPGAFQDPSLFQNLRAQLLLLIILIIMMMMMTMTMTKVSLSATSKARNRHRRYMYPKGNNKSFLLLHLNCKPCVSQCAPRCKDISLLAKVRRRAPPDVAPLGTLPGAGVLRDATCIIIVIIIIIITIIIIIIIM